MLIGILVVSQKVIPSLQKKSSAFLSFCCDVCSVPLPQVQQIKEYATFTKKQIGTRFKEAKLPQQTPSGLPIVYDHFLYVLRPQKNPHHMNVVHVFCAVRNPQPHTLQLTQRLARPTYEQGISLQVVDVDEEPIRRDILSRFESNIELWSVHGTRVIPSS